MSFQPVLPLSGLSGWRFLQRTMAVQQASFVAQPAQNRSEEHFRQNISKINNAAELVSDRQLREISLAAFGLGDDIDNTFFIKKILEEGTAAGSLASKLSDTRYSTFSDAFGFGGLGLPRTKLPDFAEEIINLYQAQSFETAVGEKDPNMRLALGLERELESVLHQSTTEDARWFSMMGSPPLRAVFEGAFGLPSSLGQLDIDQQLDIFKDKSAQILGIHDLADYSNAENLDSLRDQFLLRSSLISSSNNISAPALTLLSGAGSTESILQSYYG